MTNLTAFALNTSRLTITWIALIVVVGLYMFTQFPRLEDPSIVIREAVISAQFGDTETDEIAADALARHYPGREIIQLNVDPLGELGGGIHCATQQIPAA